MGCGNTPNYEFCIFGALINVFELHVFTKRIIQTLCLTICISKFFVSYTFLNGRSHINTSATICNVWISLRCRRFIDLLWGAARKWHNSGRGTLAVTSDALRGRGFSREITREFACFSNINQNEIMSTAFECVQ